MPSQPLPSPQARSRWVKPNPMGLRLYLLVALGIEPILAAGVLVKGKAFAFVDIGADTFCSFLPLQITYFCAAISANRQRWFEKIVQNIDCRSVTSPLGEPMPSFPPADLQILTIGQAGEATLRLVAVFHDGVVESFSGKHVCAEHANS